ncbi:GNAT family N-acetyltransferase [Glutamicibacter sp.]|uniref:GNAT family N-acetyltransferase n=1 Tax=Glutamicibacter sp. TaxID=1931995 RepID=UPI003D6A295D
MTLNEDFRAIDGELTVERATPADYQCVGELTAESYFAAGHFSSPEDEYLNFVRKVAQRAAQSEIYVVRRAGVIIGSMTLIRAGSDYADIARADELEIRMLSVDPAAQRSGVGRTMVVAAIERARLLPGINAVSLTTGSSWVSARSLYESLGFVHYPERDWVVPDTDIELVVYAYSLRPR